MHYELQKFGFLRRWLYPDIELIRCELRLMNGPWTGFKQITSTHGMSERVVEIPWVISRVANCARLLDIGTAWAHPVYIDSLARMRRETEIIGIDLAPKKRRGIRIVGADVRHLPWPDDYFDVVVCLSTLEHVGMDNLAYGWQSAIDLRQDVPALAEMARVAKRDGRIMITVPIGKSEDYGWFHQYDLTEWENVVEVADLHVQELTLYAHTPIGWVQVGVHDAPKGRYGELGTRFATGVLCTVLSKGRD
jgi:O-antigen chain-terminating methyltransferase